MPIDLLAQQPINTPPPVDLLTNMPEKDNTLSWRQGKESTLLERFTDMFGEDTSAQSQKATNALTYSQMFNISPSQAYDLHDEISAQVKDKLATEKIVTETKGIKGAVSSGIDTSLFGMMARQKVPEQFESASQAERWIHGMTSMALDLPFFMAGYGIGGANPISGTAGGFGFMGGMRQVLMDRYSKGEAKDGAEFLDRVVNAAKETLKGEVVGGFTGAVGYMAPVWLQKMAPGSNPVGWKAATELATMTAAGKLIEGQLPTTRDLVDNAAILLTMHAGIKGAESIKARIPEVRAKLQEVYTETGIHPKEIKDIITNEPINPKEDVIDKIDRVATEIKQTLPPEPVEKAEPAKTGEGKDTVQQQIVEPGATSGGKQPLDMVDTDAVSFIAGRDKSQHTEFLTPYTPEELSGATIKKVSGLDAGYVVKPDGDIVNVYNNTPHKGLGAVSVIDAIQKGGKTLDCVDNYLVQFYKSLGFVETKRVKFDPAQAPKNWDFEKHGSPDIVFLKHEGETNANYLKRSYETRWNRRLDTDPVTAEVFDRINRRATETSPEGVVSTTTNTTNKQGAIGTGVQRDLTPTQNRLDNPATEISKPLSEQATPKNADMFGNETTSIGNKVVNADRIARGLEPLESSKGLSAEEIFNLAKDKVDKGEINPDDLTRRINNSVEIGERPPALTEEQNNAMSYRIQQLKNEHKSLQSEIEKAKVEGKDTVDLQNRSDNNEVLRDATEKALRATGTEQSAALRSRQNTIAEDYSYSGMIQKAKDDGIEITPEIRTRLKEASQKIEKAQKELDNHGEQVAVETLDKTIKQIQNEEGLKQRKQKREVKKEELDTEFDNMVNTFVKEHRSEFSANPFADPARYKFLIDLTRNRIQKGFVKAEDIVDSIHIALKNAGLEISKRDLRDAISQYGVTKAMSKDDVTVALREAKRIMKLTSALEDIEAGIKPLKSGLQREPESPEVKAMRREVAQAMRESGLDKDVRISAFTKLKEKQIAEFERRIKEGDFSKAPKKEPLALGENELKLQFKLDKLKHDYEKSRMEDMLSKRGITAILKDSVFESLNLIKAIKSSYDVSAPGRQAFFYLLSHPIQGFKNIPEMFRALGSEEAAFRIAKEISERVNAKLYKEANLSITESGGTGSKAEEMYRSRWAQTIPGISASERAFVSYLNLARANLFDSMHKFSFSDAKATTAELQALGDYVNQATGRGTLKGYENALQGLGSFMWAPKLVLSRFQMILGKGLMPGGGRTAATRKAVAMEYARILGSLATIYAVNSIIGEPVETDPTSSDFGKIKIGNTRIDLLAGVSQATVFMSRIAFGETKSITTGQIKEIRGDNVPYGGSNTWDVIANFMRTKLTPALGLGINLVNGKNLVGEKVTLYDIPTEVIVPLAVRDIYDAMNEEGIPAGMALGTLGMFGVGIQTYEQKGASR